MRKLVFVALMASVSFLGFTSVAGATSVNLHIVGAHTNNNGIHSVAGDAITINPSGTVTITVDVQLDVDSRGTSAAFLSLLFDTDGGNELNMLSFDELAWSKTNKKGVVQANFTQLTPGIGASQESQDGLEGQLFTFEGASTGAGPSSTTLTFARVVFETNHGKVITDGDDIFSGQFGVQDVFADNGTPVALNIASSVTFGGIAVNLVPEPGTISLLGLGIGALVLAGRRRGRK